MPNIPQEDFEALVTAVAKAEWLRRRGGPQLAAAARRMGGYANCGMAGKIDSLNAFRGIVAAIRKERLSQPPAPC